MAMQLIEAAIPLHRPFRNAGVSVAERRVVLVAVSDGEDTGWGEAAPYPGVTAETVDDVWAALSGDRQHMPPTAAAALSQAEADLTARQGGLPLWRHLGGTDHAIEPTLAVGLNSDLASTADEVEEAFAAGYRSFKLKIAPGHDVDTIKAVRDRVSHCRIAVDANASYAPDDPLFGQIDQIDVAYLEQPLAPTDLAGHRRLADRLDTPICLDETVHDPGRAIVAIEGGAGDMLALKPGILGLPTAVEIARRASEADIALKASGLIETTVGRNHTLALASLPGFTDVDFTPATWFLTNDVTREPVTIGSVRSLPGPGLGFDVDLAALEDCIVRTLAVG